SPALFGLFRPMLLIPAGLEHRLTDDEWSMIFRHELSHYRRKDLWINAVVFFLACFHWFNPFVWLGLRRMRMEQELACDAAALSNAPADRVRQYALSMVKIAEFGLKNSFQP